MLRIHTDTLELNRKTGELIKIHERAIISPCGASIKSGKLMYRGGIFPIASPYLTYRFCGEFVIYYNSEQFTYFRYPAGDHTTVFVKLLWPCENGICYVKHSGEFCFTDCINITLFHTIQPAGLRYVLHADHESYWGAFMCGYGYYNEHGEFKGAPLIENPSGATLKFPQLTLFTINRKTYDIIEFCGVSCPGCFPSIETTATPRNIFVVGEFIIIEPVDAVEVINVPPTGWTYTRIDHKKYTVLRPIATCIQTAAHLVMWAKFIEFDDIAEILYRGAYEFSFTERPLIYALLGITRGADLPSRADIERFRPNLAALAKKCSEAGPLWEKISGIEYMIIINMGLWRD